MSVRFAVLGAGRIGQVHARAISSVPGAELVAIAEPFESAAQAAQAAFGCELRSIEDCATASDIDAVVICTPTDTHADLIEQFAKAGKAIFCEKPVDLDAGRVRQALATVEAEKATLMVGFNRRFDPDFMAVRQAIADGKVGDVEMVTITSRDPGPPPYAYIQVSGGIFRDMTIHDFDIARWLLGEEVETVSAMASVLVDKEIGALGDYDSVNVILKTATGKQCVITNSRRATYGYDQRIEVLGSLGMVQAKNTLEANVEMSREEGISSPPLLNFFMTRYTVAYANEIAAFVEAVAHGAPTPTTGHDGLMALMLADAAVKSVEEGRVIKVSDFAV